MREKLIELHKVLCKSLHCNYDEFQCAMTIDTLITAENLIANGVVVLPCNIGDKIYYIDRHTQTIEEDTVKFLTITKSGIKPILESHNIKFWDFYKWGKSVFSNRAEAESVLREPLKED